MAYGGVSARRDRRARARGQDADPMRVRRVQALARARQGVAPPLHPLVRRAMLLLAASYAFVWAAISMTAGPGPSALVRLTGDASHAGIFFAVFSLASAGGAAAGGRLMDALGRRPVLVGAHVAAAGGYAAVGLGAQAASLPLFLAGLVLLAFATGSAYLTRVASAEIFPAAQRGRGLASALLGAAAGALLGPALLVATGGSGLSGVWFVAAPLPLVAGVLVLLAPEPMRIARDPARYHAAAPTAPPAPGAAASASAPTVARVVPGGRGPVAAAIVTLTVAQMAMVGLMGVAGAWLGHAGHGVQEMGATMAMHFVGMFLFAPLVGLLADRIGRPPTLLIGLGILGAGALVIALLPGLVPFGLGLFLVGLGWSFAYVGASVLLADATPLERRARVVGRADLAASLASGAAAAAAGVWYAREGLPGLGLAAIAALAIPVVVIALHARRSGGAPAPA